MNPTRIHVFRHYMTPFVEALVGNLPCQLDLDESEARTRRSLSALASRNGHKALAARWGAEAKFYEVEERRLLPSFERIFVASNLERSHLLSQMPGLEIAVIPNVVRIPAIDRRGRADALYTFLFVGNLGYYPNDDGIRFLSREVLPILQARARGRFRILVAGANASRGLKQVITGTPAMSALGYVAELSLLYQATDAVLIPLRAGGGTRIKAIEAFAHRVPVISTTVGVEGLPVRDGEHLLIGDHAESFAHACLQLMERPILANTLAEAAFEVASTQFNCKLLADKFH